MIDQIQYKQEKRFEGMYYFQLWNRKCKNCRAQQQWESIHRQTAPKIYSDLAT